MTLAAPVAALGLWLAAAPARAQDDSQDPSVVSEDIVIRGKPAPGPAVAPPPVHPEKPLVDEVIRSLDIYNKDLSGAPQSTAHMAPKHLSRSFPEPPFLTFSPESFTQPYQSWRFEVYGGKDVVWHAEGNGPLRTTLEWDGTDGGGRFVAQTGVVYSYRFIGVQANGDERTVASEPLELTSLYYRQDLGGMRMEVANSTLFHAGKAAFRSIGTTYLMEIASRLRVLNPKDKRYHLVLYQEEAGGKLATARSAALRNYFAKALLLNPDRVGVEVLGIIDRGDVTACDLPIDADASIRSR